MGIVKSKLKKRLRKKYHLGEFKEFGFKIFFELSDLSDNDADEFYRDFIGKIESLNLSFGGGSCSQSYQGFVSSAKEYSSPSEAQKEKLENWLENRSEVKRVFISEFSDGWHSR